jgi:hypothetical protein
MATFNININGATAPSLTSDIYNIQPNTQTTLSVTDNDFLGATPSVLSIEIPPAHGNINIIGLNVAYTPTVGYIGSDSFYYKITDANGNTDVTKVILHIYFI